MAVILIFYYFPVHVRSIVCIYIQTHTLLW